MAETGVLVPNTGSIKMHGWDRTITGPGTVQDEYIQHGEVGLPTYIISGSQTIPAAANDHIGQIMAGSTLPVRVRRIRVSQHAAPAAVAAMEHQVVRLTTAGTGGTAITARPYDTTAAAAGATGIALPGVKGTEGVVLLRRSVFLGTAAIPLMSWWEWIESLNVQPLIIPAGTANGLAIKAITGGTASFTWEIEFTETTFV